MIPFAPFLGQRGYLDARKIAAAAVASSFKPSDYGAQTGDLLAYIGVCDQASSFTVSSDLFWRLLTASDVSATYTTPGAGMSFILLRNVKRLVARTSGSGTGTFSIGGFARNAGHNGLLFITETTAGCRCNATVGGSALSRDGDFYSSPSNSNKSIGLFSRVRPAYDVYANGAALGGACSRSDGGGGPPDTGYVWAYELYGTAS